MLNAYLQVFLCSYKEQSSQWLSTFSKVIFYLLVLFTYSAMIMHLPNGTAIVLYIVLTEWIFLSLPETYREIEREIDRGTFEHQLNNPKSVFWFYIFKGWGASLPRAMIILVTGLAFYLLKFGFGQGEFKNLPIALLMGCGSILILTVFEQSMGYLRFWIHRVQPVVLIWQKFALILGGVIIPLSLYPEWLKKIAVFTPFYISIFKPASMILKGEADLDSTYFLGLIGWFALGLTINFALLKAGLRRYR